MPSAINSAGLLELLLTAGEYVEREQGRLNTLDSAIGDGDHGITMKRGFQAVKKAAERLPPDSSPDQVLITVGKAFTASTGGAIGVILGRAFIAAGQVLQGRNVIEASDWKRCFRAMEQEVGAVGKAKPGDKTLLDGLHAVNKALAALDETVEAEQLLAIAAEAAERGAAETAAMHCRKGRASRLGDRALGHEDPGSVSFAIIIRAIANRIHELPLAAFANS